LREQQFQQSIDVDAFLRARVHKADFGRSYSPVRRVLAHLLPCILQRAFQKCVVGTIVDQEYDAVICMGNSLQFFNEEDVIRLLSNISEHLKAKGKLFINTWSIAEIAMNSFKEKSWSKIGELLFLTESKFLFHPTRIETNSIIITDTGEKEEKTGIDFIYSISELESIFNKTGFQLKEIYSIPGKKRFTVGEPRAYIVAEKI